jgi:hypothetical protein
MEEPGTQRLTNDDFRRLLASGAKGELIRIFILIKIFKFRLFGMKILIL